MMTDEFEVSSCEKPAEMEIFEFKDQKTVPDPIHVYTDALRSSETPLIIDNGSYQCRVGWVTDDSPILRFKSVIAKPRKERSKKEGEIPVTPQTQVGNDITNLEAVRFQLKTQFDRDVVTHFEAQEHIFDYLFAHLGVDNEGSVPHPIVMTEAYLNPNYSRQLMSELLFECYCVPGVAYGVDGLFSHLYADDPRDDALLVSLGHHNVQVVPVVEGVVRFDGSRRLNTGGSHIVAFLHRLLQLKYPAHSAAITLGRAEELLHRHCAVAVDYTDELRRWSCAGHYERHTLRIQLPYAAAAAAPGLTAEQQKERKRELARRLMEMNARKRDERLAEDLDRLARLLALQRMPDDGDEQELSRRLLSHGLKSTDELQRAVVSLSARVDKTRQKIAAAASAAAAGDEDERCKPTTRPDKSADRLEPGPHEDLQTWLVGVKRRRQDILSKRAARKQRRTDMAKRRTAAAQERMRLISQLARKEKGHDDFGMRDEDWDVYKTISREAGDSDSELETERLLELDEVIRQHEPAAADGPEQPGETYQLHLGVERVRAPELLFQPSMMGSAEAGLAETIAYVLAQFEPALQRRLAANIVLCGGPAALPGLAERLTRELREVRPHGSPLAVRVVGEPALGAWTGARNWARSGALPRHLVSRADYLEFGGEYFKPFDASNLYVPSPKAQGVLADMDIV